MKVFFYLAMTFLSTIVDAAYVRAIIVDSLVQEKKAQERLVELEAFVNLHDNIGRLQKSDNFKLQIRKSGKYYIVAIEPFRQRKALQEVLDTLRLVYKDVYVVNATFIPKNLDAKPEAQSLNENIEEEKTPQAIIIEEKSSEKENVLAPVETIDKKVEDVQLVVKETPQCIDVTSPVLMENKKDETKFIYNLWMILFFITFFAILVAIRYLFKYKKDEESYVNRDMMMSEKLKQSNAEIKMKEKFIAHASHELRSPLTAIMGLTHLVLENDLPKFQKSYIQNIEYSAQHLLNIVNDILDVSKIEAGELEIETKEFNINDIFEYVLNTASMQIKGKNVSLSVNVEKEIPSRVVGDSLRLGQILINILANAIKFTKEGEVCLEVKKVESYGETILLEFSVSDTGIGMTEEQTQGVFNSYSQASDATSRKFGGTGLGLSISKQLIEMMGGQIVVKSQKDIGSTFTFTILFKLKDSQNQRYYRLPSSTLLNKRILIVDYSIKNATSLTKALEYFKYTTHVIPSFEESILDESIEFDIIIVNKSNLTKFTIDKIKENYLKPLKKVKIVVLSLYSDLSRDVTKELKIDAYLKTPFTQQSVLNMIIELYVSKNAENALNKKNTKDKLKSISGKKILVAEDNVLNHKVISGLLSNTGIELTFVINGQEVIDLLQKGEKFDMILMDINMPVLNGYEATKEIRKSLQYGAMPIVALTADVMQESIEKAYAVGMQGHISKPIIIDVFYKKIFDMLTTPLISDKNRLSLEKKSDDEFAELSISVGLSGCNNDKAFYQSILKEFQMMYENSDLTLEKLCKNNQFKDARQMSMDIKDVALNIGAYKLCESTAAMEYEFEKGFRGNWKEIIESYRLDLDKLFLDIEKYNKNS